MFVLNLVVLALLSASSGLSGIPRYIHGQWVISEDNLPYEDANAPSLAEESVWPDSPSAAVDQMLVEDQNMLTTPEQYVLGEQASDEEGDSAVWKIVLVVAVLLVSVVGSLSMAYYLCIWRGGRIHYQPQKQSYT
ncbi:Hypothetical protein SMAX5B_003641 [Scophthalmus maximus]|uniref:Uncharacterized protein n=1 Tax=Scophthalmus maximus TaxID=52904 RepID=A0A2U9CFB6_SCOMX|nr:Hypothetical protein SMAX5B_003641 [Scophthalmus maximus]